MKRKKKSADPHLKREQEKYSKPIPSREFILERLEKKGGPASFNEIAETLGLSGDEDLEALSRRLRAMERDGQLIRNRRGGYGLIDKMDLVRGRVVCHPDGYGYVLSEGDKEKVFLPFREMRALFHDDRVLVCVTGIDKRKRKEGNVAEILTRAHDRIVGRLFKDNPIAYVVPDNPRIQHEILIPSLDIDIKQGQLVVAEISSYPSRRTQAIGRIAEVLDEGNGNPLLVEVAMRSHGIPHEWPEKVLSKVSQLPQKVLDKEISDRVDCRNLPLVTIDGQDARDFDDAVYCEALPNGGWKLYVAIADVSHYVQPNTALDKEAFNRGNSTYFPGFVVPMLPEALSNGLCSLNPLVDRLCMMCEMRINDAGIVLRSKFYPAVMHSKARLTYDEVDGILEGTNSDALKQYSSVVEHIHTLYQLYSALHQQRKLRGALDFDTTETKILFGNNDVVEDIVAVTRKDSHRLIEECMLCANVSTAKFLLKHKMPALYRNHEPPETERVDNLKLFLREFDLTLATKRKPKTEHFYQLMEQVGHRPDAHVIQTVMLRTMNQAQYGPKNLGHFGLAYKAYTHFTSPIRRYPDLLVHRAIKHVLEHGSAESFNYTEKHMQRFSEHCSVTERRSDEAAREVEFTYKCEFMLEHLGSEFDGTVSGVTSFGLFVEIDELFVDGLVHVSSLNNDYYHFDPGRHKISGEKTGDTYGLGDRVRVKVSRVSLEDKKIDFELISTPTTTKSSTKRPTKKKKSSTSKKRRSKKR